MKLLKISVQRAKMLSSSLSGSSSKCWKHSEQKEVALNKAWRGRGKSKRECLFRSQDKEELAGILWLGENTVWNQRDTWGNRVRQATWIQTWDGLGVRQRNSHLKWLGRGGHWTFLSRGNERIYFSSSPWRSWKVLVGTTVWDAREDYLKGKSAGLGS